MKTIVGLFRETYEADQAVTALENAGFIPANISVLARDQVINTPGSRNVYDADADDIYDNEDIDAVEGAGVGAAGGAVVGGLTGLLMGLGAIVVPGVGPVIAAGTLATALASAAGGAVVGAAAGAVTGGIVAALVDLGVPEDEANFYAEGVKRGGILVTVQTDEARASEAESIMHRFDAVDVDTHGAVWQEEGWDYFDEVPAASREYPTAR
jgi:hypothetical protein